MLTVNNRSLAPLLAFLALGLFPLVAFGKEWRLNMTEGVTSVSQNVYSLHMLILGICCVIGVVVFTVMFISMYLHRKSRGVQASQFHESIKLELIWTFIPALILIGMAFPATSTLIKIYDTENADLDIMVTGYQWKWRYEYLGEDVSFFSNLSDKSKQQVRSSDKSKTADYLLDVDNVLVIPVGKKVRFLVTADDVIHSWWIPALGVKRDAIPGFVNESWTYVETPGVYRGQCAELCGKDHGFMPIVVKAVEAAEFDRWMAKKRQTAQLIAQAAKQRLTFEQLYTQGESVYNKQCAVCHQANGQGVPGAFPAIANSPIATGSINDHLNRVINGGKGMPPFGEQLTPVETAAVITFQRNAFGNKMGQSIQPIDVVNFKQAQ